jgi:hypothetical protein
VQVSILEFSTSDKKVFGCTLIIEFWIDFHPNITYGGNLNISQ